MLANDTDQDSPTLTAELVTDVNNGTLNLNQDGSFTYTPVLNSYGTDSFTYRAYDGELYSGIVTVTIHVIAVNDPPVADAQTVEVNEDASIQITLTGSDVEGAPLFFLVYGQPLHGTVSLSGAVATYTPFPNFNGLDDFDFITIVVVADGALSAPAQVLIHVKPVNDAPTFTVDPITEVGATQGAVYVGTLAGSASDIDVDDSLTYSLVGSGWLNVAPDGTLSGTPANSDVGSNFFTVRVTDSGGLFAEAVLNIEVANINDAPTFTADPTLGVGATEDVAYLGTLAGTAIDIDTDDAITFSKVAGPAWLEVASNGTLSGTPGNNDVGSNVFTVRVTDSSDASTKRNSPSKSRMSTTRRSSLRTRPLEPGATEDVAYTGTLDGAASDVDALETLTYTKVSGPAWLQVAPSGALTGTPGNDDVGSNVFTVRVTDASEAIDEALLTIDVANVNDAPAFTADPTIGAGATEDTAYVGTLDGTANRHRCGGNPHLHESEWPGLAAGCQQWSSIRNTRQLRRRFKPLHRPRDRRLGSY